MKMHAKNALLEVLTESEKEKYRPIPFWSWNDRLETEKLRLQIDNMQEAGMGGFFMHARGGLETEYLQDDWFRAVDASVDEAKKRGIKAWCYDENGWPSGFAGGKLLEKPEYWAHYLLYEESDRYDKTALGVYALEEENLKRVSGADPKITKYLCVYDCRNSSTVDILNPKVTDEFLGYTHEKYAERYGENMPTMIAGFFTDEPQYFRYETAYSPEMIHAYREKYGLDILDELGALFVDCAQAPGFRFRYWRLMGELYTDNFISKVQKWCHEHGCRLTGHTVEESGIETQMWCCAGAMPFYEYEDIPGVDWLGRQIDTEMTPRQASSVAQQLGKKQVITETFACAGWDVTPRELKRIAEWQYVNGVNLMCHHLYPYSIRGQRKRDYPAFFSEHNPWTDELKHFNEYFTRLGCLLGNSTEVANVLIVHPIHSAYLTFDRKNDKLSVQELSESWKRLIEKFGGNGIGHHYGDERIMEKYARVEDGLISIGKCSYSYVVIPSCSSLDHSTVTLLKDFLSQGGKLWISGNKPTKIDGENADLGFLESNITFEQIMKKEAVFQKRYEEVRCTLRMSSYGDFLYAVNLSETRQQSVCVRLPYRGAVQLDLQTETIQPVKYSIGENEITAHILLAPGESTLIVRDDDAEPDIDTDSRDIRTISLLQKMLFAEEPENAMLLDYARLSYDGINYSDSLPVIAISERLLREQTNRSIWLKYQFTVETAELDKLYLETETIKGSEITVNDVKCRAALSGVLDDSFRRAEISDLIIPGNNEIVIRIDYYQPQKVYDVFNGYYYGTGEITETLLNCISYATDIEAIYLFGHFGISADYYTVPDFLNVVFADKFSLRQMPADVSPHDITVQGFPFFHGRMKLETTVDLPHGNWVLRADGRVQYIHVWANGTDAGVLMLQRELCLAKYLHEGSNTMIFELVASNRNLFGPHHNASEPEPTLVSPTLFSLYGTWENGESSAFRKNYAFVPFGLERMELIEVDNGKFQH